MRTIYFDYADGSGRGFADYSPYRVAYCTKCDKRTFVTADMRCVRCGKELSTEELRRGLVCLYFGKYPVASFSLADNGVEFKVTITGTIPILCSQ